MNDISLSDIVMNLALGLVWTFGLSMIAFIFGGLVGLALLFSRISKNKLSRSLTKIYIEIFQGTPLLLQLFIIFFGVSLAGLEIPAWLAAGLGLTLFTSAFLAEIWRGCVESIPNGQWEASASLAMNHFEQMRYIILPQAFRISIPPTVGFSVQVVKATAVTSIIGFVELTKTGTMLANATFQPFLVFAFVALGYFLLCYPLSFLSKRLERNLHAARAS
ncbi:amino acid ABC transporter permease [Polynucleobacter sp. QLW-P1DATA-2]|uniref:amino acid ABC transporter permease n=1 Tax=unclassified Polynucleobacter TaxID=2640945 RepID=UPI0008F80876|nr:MULTISPECIES: amino acid ABC transporter permease [unclassified Polynucleobacter]OIN01112.1 amino acid ABC transporter permease [Polynucleobacter sp. QLW-P1DATA-2]OIN02680.1 amino acid ABC transporter permease [Polynucleobacter sp. MWH-Tro8-2-5-gr]